MRSLDQWVNHSVLTCLLADSVQVMSSYCDVVVIRHPHPGAVQVCHHIHIFLSCWWSVSVCVCVCVVVYSSGWLSDLGKQLIAIECVNK